MISILEVSSEKVWKVFVESSEYCPFQQSWQWGEFQRALGKTIYRWGIYENDDLVGICLGVVERSKFGEIIYCPRGPVIEWGRVSHVKGVLKELIKYVNDVCSPIFIRLDPSVVDATGELLETFRAVGFHDSIGLWQVNRAWILEIKEKSDEEILRDMRKNTRYYLRKAMKSGIEVEVSENIDQVEKLGEMLGRMSSIKKFAPMSTEYLKKQFEILGGNDGFLKMYLAKKNGEVIAGAIISFWGNEASYLHGASEGLGDSQAPYLLQWEAIRDARDSGIERYNFWGVIEDEDYHPGHPGFGYSNFKRGFGGGVEEYVGGKDFVYKPFPYLLFRTQEKIRALMYKGN